MFQTLERMPVHLPPLHMVRIGYPYKPLAGVMPSAPSLKFVSSFVVCWDENLSNDISFNGATFAPGKD